MQKDEDAVNCAAFSVSGSASYAKQFLINGTRTIEPLAAYMENKNGQMEKSR